MMISIVLLILWALPELPHAFTPPNAGIRLPVRLFTSRTALEEAADLKAQAERIRLEAAKMDAALTLDKIANLERRLNDRKWLDKHKDEEPELLKQLENLNQKMSGEDAPSLGENSSKIIAKGEPPPSFQDRRTLETVESTLVNKNDEARLEEVPIEGFTEEDLELFLPVALRIEAEMPHATLEERLAKFREEPTLQDHFQKKIQELIVSPMEELQELTDLREQYLSSSSSVEKDTIKRQIDRLEAQIESPYSVTDSIYRGTKPMSQEELNLRIERMQKLPELLQALYMRRIGVLDETDLELGILIEHHDEQLQLLDQVRYINPLPDADRQDAIKGYKNLPPRVQTYFLKSLGLEPGVTEDEVVEALKAGGVFVSNSPMKMMVEKAGGMFQDLPEYNDIEFLERSQYIEELLPSITFMESVRPSQEDIDRFATEILDSKIYGLRSKPERVYGGYYVRGFNAIQDEDANNLLVDRLNKKLANSDLADKLQFFFIPDPKALTDEEIDMGVEEEPVLVVTGVNPKLLYKKSDFWTKPGITLAGLFSLLIFSLGTCELNEVAMANIEDALQAENVDEILRLTSNAVPVGLSIGATMLAHEAAHRVMALKNGFKVGLPNVVPSLQLGITGTITPLESPPKNFASLFDFAIAGPLAGYFISLFLLVTGLHETASTHFSQQALLPALPTTLLKSSAVGGALVEFFLGNGAVSRQMMTDFSVLPMHPFAIAGFIGLVVNALALLPLGHTDGGRVALAMFGRRGTYLLKAFTTLALCAISLFGFDESRLLITYVLFISLWQRELEAPMQNEVDQLDDIRSLLGFMSGLIVTLTLLPMP